LPGISRRVPLLAAVALAACLAVAVAGDVAGDVAVKASVPSTTRAVSPPQRTGTELAAALAPQSAFPAGFTAVKEASQNSGDALLTAPATVNLATLDCASLETTSGLKLGMSAWATSGTETAGTVSGQAYAQQLEQYATAARAAAVFSGIRAAATRCPSFTFNSDAARVSQRVTPAPPVDGNRAFLIQQSIVDLSSFGNGALDFLYVLSGPDIIVIAREGYDNPPPDTPSEASLAAEVIARIQALPLPRPPAPGQLTGTQLASRLLPVSDFPATYTADSTQTGNSGSTLLPGQPAPAGSAGSSPDCQQPFQSVGDSRGMSAYAGMLLSNSDEDQLGQYVYQFGTAAEATSFLRFLLSEYSLCPEGDSTVNGVPVAYETNVAPTVRVAGHAAYLVTQVGTSSGSPYDADELIVVSGTDLYVIAGEGPDVSATTRAYIAWLIPQLIARVQALKHNG
jgi:hypothetical protein